MSDTPKCAKCGSSMEEGFTLDLGHGNSPQPAAWVSGPPEQAFGRSFWMGIKMKAKDKRQIHTFRCIRCGFLESYAC